MGRSKSALATLQGLEEPVAQTTPADAARQWLNQHQVCRVRVGGFDIDGIFRGKLVSCEKFLSALEGGFGFCDVIFGWDSADQLIDGLALTGWHTGYPDALAKIDLSTGRLLPWDSGTALYLVDFWNRRTGEPLSACPRQLLKRVVGELRQRGAVAKAGFEYEFFFFRETPDSVRAKHYRELQPLSPGMFGYSVLRASEHATLVNRIFDELSAAQIGLEGMHTETGPGVYECAIAYDDALAAADKAALFKTAVKEIARRHGLMACFMAKWNAGLPGCSGHLHLSLWDANQPKNRFAHAGGISSDFESFVAGMLLTLPESMVMVAPTVNSYKRTLPNTWAPTTASWGVENRTAAIRAIPGGEKATRLEFRVPGADANPYLVLAAALATGMLGWDERLLPPAPVTKNAYVTEGIARLPQTLEAAVDAFAKSERMRVLLGDAFVEHFAKTRAWEVSAFYRAVTDWELARYFECI